MRARAGLASRRLPSISRPTLLCGVLRAVTWCTRGAANLRRSRTKAHPLGRSEVSFTLRWAPSGSDDAPARIADTCVGGRARTVAATDDVRQPPSARARQRPRPAGAPCGRSKRRSHAEARHARQSEMQLVFPISTPPKRRCAKAIRLVEVIGECARTGAFRLLDGRIPGGGQSLVVVHTPYVFTPPAVVLHEDHCAGQDTFPSNIPDDATLHARRGGGHTRRVDSSSIPISSSPTTALWHRLWIYVLNLF